MNTNAILGFAATAASATAPTAAPADASANALTPIAPAAPAAAVPQIRAKLSCCSLKRVPVFRAGNAGGTTISVSGQMYEKMLKFASGSRSTVARACRAASLELAQQDDSTWSCAVRQRALQKLTGSYMPLRDTNRACNAVQT